MNLDEHFMRLALAAAAEAAQAGEAPIGAVLTDGGETVLATAHNAPIATHDPSAHAEIRALRQALAALGNYRAPAGWTLYVTLEPCAMCAGAISHARVTRLVYGAADLKGGAVDNGVRFFEAPTCHWRPSVTGGVLAENSAALLRAFFKARRG